MNDRKIIRWLLASQWVLPIVAGVQNEFHLRRLPAPVRSVVDVNLLDAWGLPVALGFGIPLLLLALYSTVILWTFRPGSGRLFLWLAAIGIVTGPFLPGEYQSGFAYTLYSATNVCTGMLAAWILLDRVPYVERPATAATPASPHPA